MYITYNGFEIHIYMETTTLSNYSSFSNVHLQHLINDGEGGREGGGYKTVEGEGEKSSFITVLISIIPDMLKPLPSLLHNCANLQRLEACREIHLMNLMRECKGHTKYIYIKALGTLDMLTI